jgi:hypothetical protein
MVVGDIDRSPVAPGKNIVGCAQQRMTHGAEVSSCAAADFVTEDLQLRSGAGDLVWDHGAVRDGVSVRMVLGEVRQELRAGEVVGSVNVDVVLLFRFREDIDAVREEGLVKVHQL